MPLSGHLLYRLRKRWDSNPRYLSIWRFSRPLVSTTHALFQAPPYQEISFFSSSCQYRATLPDMRALGIDYGTKRVGLALSDEAGIIAHPLMILENTHDAVQVIAQLCAEKEVQKIVVGKSINHDGEGNAISAASRAFAHELGDMAGLPVEFVHEGFSSFEAARMGRIEKPVANPHRREYDTGAHDDKAAAIILQRYLDSKK